MTFGMSAIHQRQIANSSNRPEEYQLMRLLNQRQPIALAGHWRHGSRAEADLMNTTTGNGLEVKVVGETLAYRLQHDATIRINSDSIQRHSREFGDRVSVVLMFQCGALLIGKPSAILSRSVPIQSETLGDRGSLKCPLSVFNRLEI